jgi:2-deoxy-D-gluconate 3-dehydrogenase
MMKRFDNKVAIVTGAGRGLGQTYAMKFAAEGAHVVGVDVGDLTETGAKIKDAGGKYTPITSDLSKLTQKGAADLVAEAVQKAGGAHILVNNAGIIRRAPAADHPEADWNLAIQINLTAPFFLCQAVAKWWLTGGREKSGADARLKIVNIASMLSFQGGILVPGYTASKSGIAGITKALANEWAKERVNVNAVAPGYVITENTRPIREDAAREASILARIPEGHWASTDEISPGVLWLASKEADYCNGTIMNIDGGWLAR